MPLRSFRKTFTRVAFLLCCLSTIWLPAPSYAQTDEDVQGMKRTVTELVKQQKYTEALPLLEKLLVVEPNNAETHFYLGFALIAQANKYPIISCAVI